MKIALVSDWSAPRVGGIESYLSDLARELGALGHAPELITVTPGEPVVDGVPVHRLDLWRVPGWQVVGSGRAIEAVRALCLRERFDVVHGVSLYSPLAHVAMFVGRGLGIPTVLSSHSLLGPAGVFLYSAWNDLHRWGSWPDVLTGVSTVAAEETRLAARRDRVHVLPNGLDLAAWSPSGDRGGPRRRVPQVVSVMRLHRRKRPLDLIRAIPRIDARLPKLLRPQFVIVGDGPERQAMERLATRLGVRDRVELLGRRPRAEVRQILSRSDIFALPTVKEAFGISVLEARAAGLPVVAMGGNGVSDLVEHGFEGLLAEGEEDFAAHIARLVEDDLLRARIAQETRRGLGRFSWTEVVGRHLALYGLAQARAGRRAVVKEAA